MDSLISAVASFSHFSHLGESLQIGLNQSSTLGLILAQTINTNLWANVQNAFKVFIESGQVWALIIGLVVGYLVRMFTTYG